MAYKSRRFSRGAKVYTKEGRAYTVEDIEDGTVYCSLANGAETEFAEASLITEAEWAAQSDRRSEFSYSRFKYSPLFDKSDDKVDRSVAEHFLAVSERKFPGLLDYVAFTIANEILTEKGDQSLLPSLSITRCRDIFDAARADVRANLTAQVLRLRLDTLLTACALGENMAHAMLEKGLAAQSKSFETFCDRPRK